MTPEQIRKLETFEVSGRDLRAALEYRRFNRREFIFPDVGRLRRELYPKQLAFFEAGRTEKQRLAMCANRFGKTEMGAYEASCHATGIYPHWWKGRVFPGPNEGWACGTNSQTTRDIVQRALIGPPNDIGTGMIPRHLISDIKPQSHGLKDAKEQILVRHASGGISLIGLKSYEQGRKSFEGTAKSWVWCDEEPPEDCYQEMIIRTMTTRGIIWLTFTPLQGMSAVVKRFKEPEKGKELWFIQGGWNDAPHIPESEKAELLRTTPAHELRARTEGEPSLGSGAVYPIAEDRIRCEEFIPPETWPRSYGLDVGFKWTAAIWGARNPATDVTYFYADYLGLGQHDGANPLSASVHAAAIKRHGEWIVGAIDPASNSSSQVDGRKLLELYRSLGLQLVEAENAVSTGISTVWEAMVNGTLKVMPSCQNFWREFRGYHRKNGKIVKVDDHIMDASRYRLVSGRALERVKPLPPPTGKTSSPGNAYSWMG